MEMAVNKAFQQPPQGNETKEVDATVETLSLLSQGWHHVPAPVKLAAANPTEGR